MQRNVLEYLMHTAQRLPEGLCYADDKRSLTFSQLICSARRIAGLLLEAGLRPNQPVAVLTRRSVRSLEGFFGALWAGGFYVPLDAAMPADRLTGILSALSPAAIFYEAADGKLAGTLAEYAPLICAEDSEQAPCAEAEPWRQTLDTDPCYMIYSSGSTGVPKGILIAHRSVIDFTDWYAEITGVDETDHLGSQAPFFFDLSVKDVYLSLKTGAETYIIPKKCFSFPVLLIRALDEQKITTLSWSTAAFHMTANSGVFEKYRPAYLKRALMGGEAMQVKQLNIWRSALPDVRYVNLYGPTETTVDCTYYPIDRVFTEGESIPIGRACKNMEVFLLNEDGALCAAGEPGEICARGTGLAIGYFGDPEKTASVFQQNPLNPNYPARIYRTGDIGCVKEDGLIYYLGRKDSQIKHNGYRIELGEIETALNALPEIREAVCFFDSEADRIVAVYVGELDGAGLVKALKARLPKYMIPEVLRAIDVMPHLPNGKTDRVRVRKEFR